MSIATDDVLAERQRQIEVEGWTEDHDNRNGPGEMAEAAAAYARIAGGNLAEGLEPNDADVFDSRPPPFWPWTIEWWKPKTPRRDLVRAAALIIAEIERIDRLTPNNELSGPPSAGRA